MRRTGARNSILPILDWSAGNPDSICTKAFTQVALHWKEKRCKVENLCDLPFQFFFISHKCLQQQLLVLFCQPLFQRFSRHFNISGARITDCGNIIYFHVDTIFSVPVLYKDQIQIHGQKCLDLKMSSVVISCGVKVLQTVQSVLHRMIPDMVLIQIISDRVGITIDIDILVLPQIHRYEWGFQSRILPCKPDTVPKIPRKASGILTIFCQFGEKVLSLLIEFQYLFKYTGTLYSGFQIFEVIGHFGQH